MGAFINQVQQNNRLQEQILKNTKTQQAENKKIRYKRFHARLLYEEWQLYLQDLVFKEGEKVYTYIFENVFDIFIQDFYNKQKNKNFMQDYKVIQEEWEYNKKIKDLEKKQKEIELTDYIYIDEEIRLKCKKCYYSCIKKFLKIKETVEEQEAIEKYNQEQKRLQEKEKNTIHVDITEILEKQEKQKQLEKENKIKKIIITGAIFFILIYIKICLVIWGI